MRLYYRKLLWFTVLVFGLSGCQRAQLQVRRLAPLPQDPLIQVFFNHNQSASYPELYRQQTRPGDDLEQVIANSIQSAKTTVDVAVHELRLPRVAQALAERQQAGVQVRVIFENTYTRPWSSLTPTDVAQLDDRERDQYQEFQQLVDRDRNGQISPAETNQGDALIVLRNAKIPWIDDTADGSAGSGLMHHKFVVVDRRTVLVTTANFTTSDIHGDFGAADSRGNPNALLKIDSPGLASIYTQEFDLMWGDGPAKQADSQFGLQKAFRPAQRVKLGATSAEVQFSPTSSQLPWEQSVNGLIGRTLKRATTSIDMALFVLSAQLLSTALENRHQQGTEIRTLIEPDYAYKSYSEGLDMLGVALARADQPSEPGYCQFEAGNRPWQQPIKTVGVPRLPQGDRLHHKFGVVDRQTVIVGSHNWSEAADQNNDENLLVIESPVVAAHFQREFERLYASAELGVPKFLQRRLATQQTQCQTAVVTPSPAPLRDDSSSGSSTDPAFASQNSISAKVNLNTAGPAELEELPGVGPKLAERIIQARQHQPFTSLTDLDQVAGVGPHLVEQLKERVTW